MSNNNIRKMVKKLEIGDLFAGHGALLEVREMPEISTVTTKVGRKNQKTVIATVRVRLAHNGSGKLRKFAAPANSFVKLAQVGDVFHVA